MTTLNNTDRQTIVEMVLYILNKTEGLDYYRLFKTIYFAERSFMVKYGMRMTKETYSALPYGPVPQLLYDAIRRIETDRELTDMLWSVIEAGDTDAYYYLVAKRPADLNYLSKCATDELDNAIDQYSTKPFGLLKQQTHGLDWQRARRTPDKAITLEDMAVAGGADSATLEYLKENEEWNRCFAD